MSWNSVPKPHVICFGWLGLKAAIRALQNGVPRHRFTLVVQEDKAALSAVPKGLAMPDWIDYQVHAISHADNWIISQQALEGLAETKLGEKLILLADLDSEEGTFGLMKFIELLDSHSRLMVLLIAVTPLSEDTLNWRRAEPYLTVINKLHMRKQVVNLPELIFSHQLGSMTAAECEKYICAYLNNLIEDEMA